MMTLKDILDRYEPLEKFSQDKIFSDLKALDESQQASLEAKAEILAFSFTEGLSNDWNTFFGPSSANTVTDAGETTSSLDCRSITPDIIKYWTERIETTSNLRLKMRYAGLVCDFCKMVTGKEPDFKKVKRVFIQTIFELVRADRLETEIHGLKFLKAAIKKSICLHQEDLISGGMTLLLDYVHKYENDQTPGIWFVPIELLTEHEKVLSDFEQPILKDNEDRLERLLQVCKVKGSSTDEYANLMKEEASLLADYYKKKKDDSKAEAALNKAMAGIRCSFKLRGAMWSQSMLLEMQKLYRRYNLDKQANKLYLDIRSFGTRAFEEMTPRRYTIPFDRKVYEEYVEDIISDAQCDPLVSYAIEHMPRMDREMELQKQRKERYPILDMAETVIYDWSGMPVQQIDSGVDGEKNRLAHGIYQRMVLNAAFMRLHIRKMEEKGIYTYEKVLARFKDSPLIADGQITQFERGLKAYFDKDYMVACHLLVPMFEMAIRNLAALQGINVMNANNKDGGSEYKSLDTLLTELKENQYVPSDMIAFFQNLFTEKCGWNIRNLISHGLMLSESFNNTISDRIVQAFLLLSTGHEEHKTRSI